MKGRKVEAILARRQASHRDKPGTRLPGSLNAHKTAPRGAGYRKLKRR